MGSGIVLTPKRKTFDRGIQSVVQSFEAKPVMFGINSEKPIDPSKGLIWVSTDTHQVYVCYQSGIFSLL
jgi:hypothetical protein